MALGRSSAVCRARRMGREARWAHASPRLSRRQEFSASAALALGNVAGRASGRPVHGACHRRALAARPGSRPRSRGSTRLPRFGSITRRGKHLRSDIAGRRCTRPARRTCSPRASSGSRSCTAVRGRGCSGSYRSWRRSWQVSFRELESRCELNLRRARSSALNERAIRCGFVGS